MFGYLSQSIKFLASRKLVEYEILMEDLFIESIDNVSTAIMKFVFRRRFEYHVANTFLQVNFIMII